MSQKDYEAAIAEFLRRKNVTRCPTACVVPTHASVTEADRLALRSHEAAREEKRLQKSRNFREIVAAKPSAAAA